MLDVIYNLASSCLVIEFEWIRLLNPNMCSREPRSRVQHWDIWFGQRRMPASHAPVDWDVSTSCDAPSIHLLGSTNLRCCGAAHHPGLPLVLLLQ